MKVENWMKCYPLSDFITLLCRVTDKSAKNLVCRAAISKMKDGVRIINCARGGLVDEEALAEAIKSGKVAGSPLTCSRKSRQRPARYSVLPNVVCTPHLGASTSEAQENVALQVAEQMSDYLIHGRRFQCAQHAFDHRRGNALKLVPFLKLAQHLGSFVGQVTEEAIMKVEIAYDGGVSQDLNIKAMTAAATAGIMKQNY